MTLSPETLRRIGPALYGDFWIAELSRRLPTHKRTVERWVSGRNATPPWLPPALAELVAAEIAALEAALAVRSRYARPETEPPRADLADHLVELRAAATLLPTLPAG